MPYDYHCDVCGDTLDPNEICDCKRAASEPEKHVLTRAEWEEAGDFNKLAHPGDLVEECIVEELRDCLPPASLKHGYLQVGEPYSHEYDPESGHWRPTFGTFRKSGENWIYCGNCFLGKITEPAKSARKEN